MIDIVELMPERPDTILNEGLDKLTVLENRRNLLFFQGQRFFTKNLISLFQIKIKSQLPKSKVPTIFPQVIKLK